MKREDILELIVSLEDSSIRPKDRIKTKEDMGLDSFRTGIVESIDQHGILVVREDSGSIFTVFKTGVVKISEIDHSFKKEPNIS